MVEQRTIGPEYQFLIEATRWNAGPVEGAGLRSCAEQVVDWEGVLNLVDRHRVAGLCFTNFAAAGFPGPTTFREGLANRAMVDSAHEMTLAAETLRLVASIERAGLSCRVLKGLATAQSVFGRLGVRFSTDIDILVDPGDVERAAAHLETIGYKLVAPGTMPKDRELHRRLARYKDLAFQRNDGGTIVELHWRLFENPYIFFGAENEPVERLAIGANATIPVLPSDTAALYLCFHGAEHAWARLKWLADLAALLQTSPSLAEELFEKSSRIGRQRLVGPALMLCKNLYGHPLPGHLSKRIMQDRRMRALIAIAFDALVGDQDAAELEERRFATTRKSISHYLMTNDPRHWFRELQFDLTHANDAAGSAPVLKRAFAVLRALKNQHLLATR